MKTPKIAILPVAAATFGAAGVAGIMAGAALVLPSPWSWGATSIALVAAIPSLGGMYGLTRLLSSVAPTEDPAPEPTRPRWQVAEREPVQGFDVDLIPQLRGELETQLIQHIEGPGPEELTALDYAFLLREVFAGHISRGDLLGIWLPSQRKLTRPLYDQFMDLATRAGVIQERKPKYSGRVTPGLTLTQALGTWGIDPASISWATLGSPGLGKAGLGTSGRFIVAKVIDEGRG